MNNIEVKRLQSLVKLHVSSFNFAISQGLRLIIHSIFNSKIIDGNLKKKLKIVSLSFFICKPYSFSNGRRFREIPRQSREIKNSYNGDLFVSILIKTLSYFPERFILKTGKIPIMIKSNKCNLNLLKSKQLIEIDEEEYETGGYFIVKGSEKILRLLIIPKRNIIQTFSRLSNSQKGIFCTVFSSSFRSVDRTQVSKTIHLHYLSNGTVQCRFIYKKHEFFIPIVILMKILLNLSDKFIFDSITNFDSKDNYLRQRAVLMIRESYMIFGNESRTELKKFISKIFNLICPRENLGMIEFIDNVIDENIFIHLGKNNIKKFQLLLAMIQKLFSVQRGLSNEDNPDSFDSQELLFPGNLLIIYLREKIENSLNSSTLFEDLTSNRQNKKKYKSQNLKIFVKKFRRELAMISKGFEFIITTGSFSSAFKNELPQTSGLSVTLERLNYGRFLSFFRSVHRGKFFSEMKNTAGRKILPQSWGFLCPVHTPDGPLCGILNHISFSAISVFCNPIDNTWFEKLFLRYGKIRNTPENLKGLIEINSDGEIIGYSTEYFLRWFVDKLRCEKVSSYGVLPKNCEFFYVSRQTKKCPPRQLFISSQESRASRPIKWCCIESRFFSKIPKIRNILSHKKQIQIIELVGVLEQNLLNIFNFEYQTGLLSKNFYISHREMESLSILSILAGSIPFSNLNQSPRNIYQCQMAKQSIGIPFYTFWRRNDSKNYLLLAPQIPIVRNKVVQDGLKLDHFPNGFNACISIISYTGFDMEDAIAINRSSIERGISYSNISSCNLIESKFPKDNFEQNFKQVKNSIEADGLLSTESHIVKGDPIYLQKFEEGIGLRKEGFFCYNSSEKAVIDQTKILSKFSGRSEQKLTSLKIRSRRRPITGDKFASRHGQKGVLSYDFYDSDLPFSEIGITPDILFNPNGLPSRMTLGLISEGLAGKSGSIHGSFHDSSPFKYSMDRNSLHKFSDQLRQAGLNYFGSEIQCSGYSGEPLKVEIFTGIIHYQRLRHMVSDKFQISNKSPVNNLTRQPIKGKKSGGAIRFGEMERDALLGHGCTFLLHDRIQISSDLHGSLMEKKTGLPIENKKKPILENFGGKLRQVYKKFSKKILIPYIIKYLISELAVINIKLNLSLSHN